MLLTESNKRKCTPGLFTRVFKVNSGLIENLSGNMVKYYVNNICMSKLWRWYISLKNSIDGHFIDIIKERT